MNTNSKLIVGILATLSLVACGPYEDYPSQETTVAKGGSSGTSASSTGGKTSATSSVTTSTGGNVASTGGAVSSTGGSTGTGGTVSGTETSPTVKADAGVAPDAKTVSPDATPATDVSISSDSAPECKDGQTQATIINKGDGTSCSGTKICFGGTFSQTVFGPDCNAKPDASVPTDTKPSTDVLAAIDTRAECRDGLDTQTCWNSTRTEQTGAVQCVNGHYAPCPPVLGLDGGSSDAQAPAVDSQPAMDTQVAVDTQVSIDTQVFGADALVIVDTQVSLDAQPSPNCGTVLNGDTIPCQAVRASESPFNGYKLCKNGILTGCIVANEVVVNCSTSVSVVGASTRTNIMQVTGDVLINFNANESIDAKTLMSTGNPSSICGVGYNWGISSQCQPRSAGAETYTLPLGVLNTGSNQVSFVGQYPSGKNVWSWNQNLLFESDPNNKCSFDAGLKLLFTLP